MLTCGGRETKDKGEVGQVTKGIIRYEILPQGIDIGFFFQRQNEWLVQIMEFFLH